MDIVTDSQIPAPLPYPHTGLLIAILLYLGLAFSYFFIVPIFEAPDEWTHTGHIKYIADGNGLPVMLPGQGIWGGQQPPFYYAIGALIVQPFDLTKLDNYLDRSENPHASIGYALDPGNKNVYLHEPHEAFPYQGLSLTVHILRLYSMGFGLITIIFTYLTALENFNYSFSNPESNPQRPARYAIAYPFATAVALLVAGQPMFAFITASVANEPANMALSAIGLWLAQRYVLRGPGRHWGRAAALGIVLGLISLSKMTGLSFGLVAVIAILQSAISSRKQPGTAQLLWRDGLIIAGLFLAVGGWWYWRNYQLYGDFFQRGLYRIYFNQEPQALSLSQFLYNLSISEVSFWATFGWLNIVAPEWVYSTYRIISRIGLLGVIIAIALQFGRRIILNVENPLPVLEQPAQNRWSLLLIHLTFPIAIAFSLTRLVATEGGLQGRQLLPALGSMAIVIMWGWWFLTPARLRVPVIGLLVTVWIGLAFWLPYTVVASEYVPRPLLTETDLPAELSRLELTYNDEIKLIGVKIGAPLVRPGERLPVTAYWQALRPMSTNYSVFVHLIGRSHQNVGQLNSYPGLGLHPTSSLQPGQIVADTYPVQIDGGSQAPTRLLVNIGLFKFNEPGRPGIQARGSAGQVTSPTIGQVKLIPVRWPSAKAIPPLAEFADNIRLDAHTFQGCTISAQECTVTLEWFAQASPAADYTVFIQLWRNDEQAAGFDAPPLDNDYPTSLWAAGEVIIDRHPLNLTDLSPGQYQVFAGLYKFSTGERLTASAGGKVLPDYAVDLGIIQIER